MLKCLNLKIYFASLILLSLMILVFFNTRGVLGLSVVAAFLIFMILCVTVIYGFMEKLEKEMLSLILAIITLFIILHYTILFLTLNVEYYNVLLLRTCKDSRCSIVLDWGQIFLLTIVLAYIATIVVRKTKRI